MILVFALVAALVVVVIALVAVGAVTNRLARQPPKSIFDLEEAVDVVADRLPAETAGSISYDDVRCLLLWQLDYLEGKGVAGESDQALEDLPSGPLVADDDEATAYVLGQAIAEGMDIDDVAVAEVLDAGMAYLREIGAIGAVLPAGPPAPG